MARFPRPLAEHGVVQCVVPALRKAESATRAGVARSRRVSSGSFRGCSDSGAEGVTRCQIYLSCCACELTVPNRERSPLFRASSGSTESPAFAQNMHK